MFLTFTPDAAAPCFLSASCKDRNRLSLVVKWRVVGLRFLVNDSGFGSLCSKVKELQQLVTIGDISVRFAMVLPLGLKQIKELLFEYLNTKTNELIFEWFAWWEPWEELYYCSAHTV